MDTCTRYVVAPETVFHVNTGLRDIFKAVLIGEINTGVAGEGGTVVKLHAEVQSLVPILFFAFTRQ